VRITRALDVEALAAGIAASIRTTQGMCHATRFRLLDRV
jgi:hypothetical protein